MSTSGHSSLLQSTPLISSPGDVASHELPYSATMVYVFVGLTDSEAGKDEPWSATCPPSFHVQLETPAPNDCTSI